MWSSVIINVLILSVGFLTGVMAGDKASGNMQMDDIRKKQRELERELAKLRRQANEEC